MKIQDNDALVTPRFRLHPTLNQNASTKAGRAIYDEIEVVEIRLAANKQTIPVFPAHEVCGYIDDEVTGQRIPQTYAMRYNPQYLAFKAGAPQAKSGTPLEALTFLSPAKRLELKALSITTAETLASLGGNPLRQLGMGGQDMKDKAVAFLEEAHEHRGETVMAARIAELEAQLASAKGEPAPSEEPEELDDEEAKSPFADYEEADIRNWLATAAPDMKLDARWGKKTLVAKADEVNRRLAEQQKAA